MSNLPAQSRAIYSVACLAQHLGFWITRQGAVVTPDDAGTLVLSSDYLEVVLEFGVTDGDLTYTYSQILAEIVADPILTLQRLQKVSASLTEFTFGE